MELTIADYDNLDMEPDTTTTLDGKRFTGLAFEILGNGNIANDFFFDGLMWGPSRIWAPNGQLIEEWWHFGVDSFHGVNRTWRLDGTLQSVEEFWQGKRVCVEEWSEDGALLKSEKRSTDELSQMGYQPESWKEYFENAGERTSLWLQFENGLGGKFIP